ncbi:RNA-binding protein 8A isoform 2 [Galdieria sulphuraria]|uniref:RNA-binding protein 8A isoform 2 n=1 Tax=Galdieria sulphuraria TaxID=130081 RepID=M2XC23_GALSU|nr:RNA-binding protein 8A isoform 2 [Galdieria sulphuraria]EME27447.1 RNA-binding protein 8A isoform 2 [Galdieria sulphuraria]|eukprot:XP_005703967.1 RNA-binding protein 8A isoform 2 [Galdieria sulphuraria]
MEDRMQVVVSETSKGEERGRGRGIGAAMDVDEEGRYTGKGGVFERLGTDRDGSGPQKCKKSVFGLYYLCGLAVEGYILIACNLHEECTEEDIYDKFSELGEVKNIHLNLDRRTGFTKGYALIEYQHFKEAQSAIEALNGAELHDRLLEVSWAFSRGPLGTRLSTRRRSEK